VWSHALNGDGRRSLLTAGDEIVTVMGDQGGAGCVDTPAEPRAALIAFLGAGLPSPASKALMVEALAGARRTVAMYHARDWAVGGWLAGEVRLRGIRENAAVLAVLELLPGRREEIARAYRLDHPDRAGALSDLLAVLDPAGSAAGLPGLRFQARASQGEEPPMSASRYRMWSDGQTVILQPVQVFNLVPGSARFRRGSLRGGRADTGSSSGRAG
jgi:hypothetical protein